MTDYIENYLFQSGDVYSLTQLNDAVARMAANDQRLLDVVAALQEYMSTTPFPTPGWAKSPAQLEAWVDMLLDVGNTAERLYPVVSPEQPRYLGELYHLFEIEPFKSLKEGAEADVQSWMPILRVFSMIKGMIYLVEDGPNYEADPVFIKDGSFFVTGILDPADDTQHLICTGDGTVVKLSGEAVYRPIPTGTSPITLIEFFLRRLEVSKLRTLYRLSAFEAGIDANYANDAPYNIVDRAFTHGSSPEIQSRRLPCGFTKAGELLYLRTEAGKYRGASLTPFIPGLTSTSGVEDRVVMAESLLMTPMGIVRIPKCVIRWGHLLSDGDRQRNPDFGDPVAFIGLKLTMELVQRDVDLSLGVAMPAQVVDSGFDGGIELLEKNATAPLENFPTPQTGTQKENLAIIGKWGHEHGMLVGIVQNDVTNAGGKFAQYVQIKAEVVLHAMFGKQIVDALASMPLSTPDELTAINHSANEIDPPPNRLLGLTPRRMLDILQATSPQAFPGLSLDIEQGVLVRVDKTPATNAKWEVVVPLFLHLMKNPDAFGVGNLNGCTTRFTDGWAIRSISSVQVGLGTVALDDGAGNPEGFPEDFLGAAMTIYKEDGSKIQTTLVGRVGDKLGQLPQGVVNQIVAGDVATFDRRKPSASLDGAYLREASVTNLVDLRPMSIRMVDPVVTPSSAGLTSPSPSPAVPWTSLERVKSQSLIEAAVAVYSDTHRVVESKLRWSYPQRALSKASERRDLVQLVGLPGADLKNFLIRWASEYDTNSPHDWIAGEGVIIHWPEKNPITKVGLTRYLPPAVPGQEDGITIETVEGYGSVPVFTRHIRSGEHYRYPLRFIQGLTFVSEKSFSIPGHTKLAGSFNLTPLSTWIVDSTVSIKLYQTKNVKGSKQQVFLGSVDIDWRRATSFSNATGVFRIDGDARYEPTSQFVLINYNQTIDFTSDEPGTLQVSFTYHDLSEVHPVFNFEYGSIGLRLGHLFDAQPLALTKGEFTNIPNLLMRLEGISLNDGRAYLRFNRDDSFAVIAAHGFIKTRWVLTGIPVITITSVTRDPASGQITDLTYTATTVKRDMTVSTLLTAEKRNNQIYQPCKLKYGWADLVQSNVNTEGLPYNAQARFGFYEVVSALDSTNALAIASALASFRPSDLDYRFLAPFSGSTSGMTPIQSTVILRNLKTGAIKAVVGVYRKAIIGASPSALEDELTLDTVMQQPIAYIKDSELGSEWVPDFIGMLVAIRDETTALSPGGDSKLAMVGYWYNGHTPQERGLVTKRVAVDVLAFDVGLITFDAAFWRIGDVPGYLYRDNTILESDRTRP